MLEYLPELMKGLHTSLTLTVASIIVALILSLIALTGVFVVKTKAGDVRVAATGASQSGVMRVAPIEQALKAIEDPAAFAGADTEGKAVGHVTLVGAGPGDPDLLTVKALRALQDADVVFYDELVSVEILDRVRRDAARIPVGRRVGKPGIGQDAS